MKRIIVFIIVFTFMFILLAVPSHADEPSQQTGYDPADYNGVLIYPYYYNTSIYPESYIQLYSYNSTYKVAIYANHSNETGNWYVGTDNKLHFSVGGSDKNVNVFSADTMGISTGATKNISYDTLIHTFRGSDILAYWQNLGVPTTASFPSDGTNDFTTGHSFRYIGFSNNNTVSGYARSHILLYSSSSAELYWLSAEDNHGHHQIVLSTIPSLYGQTDPSVYLIPYDVYYWNNSQSKWVRVFQNYNPYSYLNNNGVYNTSPMWKNVVEFNNFSGLEINSAFSEIEQGEEGDDSGIVSALSGISSGIQSVLNWISGYFTYLGNSLRSVFSDVLDFCSGFWEDIEDFFEYMFIPDADELQETLEEETYALTSSIPLVSELSTTWRYIFDTPLQNTRKGPESEVDKVNNFLFDEKLYQELENQRIGMTKSRSSSFGKNLLSNPENDLHICVPVPSLNSSGTINEALRPSGHEGEYGFNDIDDLVDDSLYNSNVVFGSDYCSAMHNPDWSSSPGLFTSNAREWVIPISLYTKEIVHFNILGYNIASVRDIVWFFMIVALWWNFFKRLTQMAFSFFESNPLSEWIGVADAKTEELRLNMQTKKVGKMTDEQKNQLLEKMRESSINEQIASYRISHHEKKSKR